tara:strand:- start:126 stop:410 length:285 start_codon:yes stop_codon:yes gene_type:complete
MVINEQKAKTEEKTKKEKPSGQHRLRFEGKSSPKVVVKKWSITYYEKSRPLKKKKKKDTQMSFPFPELNQDINYPQGNTQDNIKEVNTSPPSQE